MKKNLIIAIALLSAAGAYAQGSIVFNNLVTSVVRAPVYNPEPGNTGVQIQGNTATGTPAGSTVYTGGTVSGSGYSAQLYGGTSTTPEGSLAALGTPVFFRTGSAAGFVTTDPAGGLANPANVIVPTVAENGIANIQLRAWNNVGGTVTSYETSFAQQGINGKSAMFQSQPLGGIQTPSPNLVGLTSFNVHTNVPEPSTIALAVMGASAFLIRRRKK